MIAFVIMAYAILVALLFLVAVVEDIRLGEIPSTLLRRILLVFLLPAFTTAYLFAFFADWLDGDDEPFLDGLKLFVADLVEAWYGR